MRLIVHDTTSMSITKPSRARVSDGHRTCSLRYCWRLAHVIFPGYVLFALTTFRCGDIHRASVSQSKLLLVALLDEGVGMAKKPVTSQSNVSSSEGSLIFRGTVMQTKASTVPDIKA